MPEDNVITASYLITLEEMQTARSAFPFQPNRAKIITAVATGVLVVLMLSPVITALIRRGNRIDLSLSDAIVPIAFVLVLYLFFRYEQNHSFKKAFAQNPASNKRIEYKFSRDEIVSKIDGLFENKLQWNSIVQVRRTKKGFFFYQTLQMYIWIPEHAFQSKEDADAAARLARLSVKSYVEN